MSTATTEHYRAYSPKAFNRAERDSVTVVFGGLLRGLPLRPVPPELRAGPPQLRPGSLPHVPARPGSALPEGGHGRRARSQPAHDPRLPLGHLLHRPRAGPRVPGTALRSRPGPDRRRGQGERGVSLRHLPPPATPRLLALDHLAPHELVLHEGAARGPPEVLDHRGRPAAREAHRQDHGRVLPADRGRRS